MKTMRIRKLILRILPFLRLIRNYQNEKKRREAPVQLNDFVMIGSSFFNNPETLLESIGKEPSENLLDAGDFYPLFYNSNSGTLELLRLFIRDARPNVVIETGVANGASTRKILSSFKEFKLFESELYSFDIDPRVASPDLTRSPQFNFVTVSSPDSFVASMNEISTVDLFYHDSDHSYGNQMLEYSTAWELLNPEKGILISDDINWSNAFLDFCKIVNRVPLLLSDSGKFTGVIFK
jgi:predicted O-methyltransferase YrrM